MFSIIIPLYNKAPYIEKAIESVLSQTFQEFELIVIDDGSTDNSLEVLKKCDLSKIDCKIISQTNSGVSTARNNGVKLAKHDYIAFLDADDWWDAQYLHEMKVLIEEFPEAAMFGCSYYKVKNGRNNLAEIKFDKKTERGLINYCQLYAKSLWMPLWTGSVIIRKNVFIVENGFNPKLKLGEDFDLWIRIAMKYPIAFMKKSLAYYNQDVDINNRALSKKLYEPEQHMLFTDYGEWMLNKDFKLMYDKLAVYGLLPYFLADKNKNYVENIIKNINWKDHAFKYKIYYKILPKNVVKLWFDGFKILSKIKNI